MTDICEAIMANKGDDKKSAATKAIFDKIGGFGLFQKLFLGFMLYVFLGWACFSDASIFLLTAEPPWECVKNSTVCNITGSIAPGQPNYDFRCGIPRQEWKFIDEYTSLITQFDLVCDKAAYGPSIIITDSIGGFFGSFGAGLMSDKFGRKKALFVCGFFEVFSLFFLRYSPAYPMAVALIFFQSLGLYGIISSGLTILLESVGIKQRPLAGAGLWISYGWGFMIFGGIGYLIRDWKLFMMILAIMGMPPLLMYWFVPESLRWLIVTGRIQEARQTLERIAKINGRDIRGDEINLPSYEKEEKSLGDVRILFSKKYIVSTLVLWYNSLVGAMIYNGLHFTAPNLGGNMYLNWFLSGVGETFGTIMSIYVHTRFGRRKTTAVCEIMAGLASMVSVVLILYDDGSQGFLIGKIIFTMVVAKFFITSAYSGVALFVAEIYPTPVRNVAQGLQMTFGCIGFAISGYLTYLIRVHYILPYAIMAVNALIAASLCFAFLKETKHIPIPDTIDDEPEKENLTEYTMSNGQRDHDKLVKDTEEK